MSTSILPRFCFPLVLSVLLAACQAPSQKEVAVPVLPIPQASHEFDIDPARDDVVGELQRIRANEDDTLSDIARRFNVGYEEIVSANPGVDPWLPGAGTEIVVPTQFVLPDAPRQGLVINLAAMRLFYFPKAKPGEAQRVITHPIGIGRIEWKTPEGVTKVTAKAESPTWIPTKSIRREHAREGDPLPAKVGPGPDNPMGTHVLRLGWPSYAIHGTNKPPSIGLRGSHGCLRLYPEDIVRLYDEVPVGARVTVVNQPYLFGWRGNELYMQAYPVLEDDRRNHQKLTGKLFTKIAGKRGHDTKVLNQGVVADLIASPRAIALPVSDQATTIQGHLDQLRWVQNRLPQRATWDGNMDQQLTAAEVIERATSP